MVEHATPFDGKCDRGELRKSARKYIGEPTLQVVIVEGFEAQIERRVTAAQRHRDAIVRHWNRPEQAIRGDVRVVVVNLIRSNWTVEYVESDETERRVVVFPVDGNVLADHEAHVSLKRR